MYVACMYTSWFTYLLSCYLSLNDLEGHYTTMYELLLVDSFINAAYYNVINTEPANVNMKNLTSKGHSFERSSTIVPIDRACTASY